MLHYSYAWQRCLALVSSVVLIVAALWWAREVIIPLVLAILISFVLTPVVGALQRLGLGRVPAVVTTVVVALVVVGVFGVVLLGQTSKLAADLPNYQQGIAAKITQLHDAAQAEWLQNLLNIANDVSKQMKQDRPPELETKEPLLVEVKPSVYPLLQTAANSFVAFCVQAGLMLILLIFVLVQHEDLRDRLIRLWGSGNITGMTKALDDAGQRLSRFLMTQLFINVAYGAAVGGGLTLLGFWIGGEPFPYALVAGLLSAVLRYIPYLGPWIAAAFPTLVALAFYPHWAPLLWVLGWIVVLEIIIANFLEPWLYGHSIGVSEIALLVAAAFWTWLWGPIGLILAPPMTVCLAVAGRFIPQLEFLDILLSNRPALEPQVRFFQRLLACDQDEATELAEDFVNQHPERHVFDEIVTPALLLAERNLRLGELTDQEAQNIFATARQIVEEIDLPGAAADVEGTVAPQSCPILGVPAKDEADEVILMMLARLLAEKNIELPLFSPKLLASELLAHVAEHKPALVCLGALPAGRNSHARYLCFRLRARFPEMKIIVVSPGDPSESTPNHERLKQAGADEVSVSLQAAQAWLMPQLALLTSPPQELRRPA